jgi:hypothetical protein
MTKWLAVWFASMLAGCTAQALGPEAEVTVRWPEGTVEVYRLRQGELCRVVPDIGCPR